MACLPMRQRYIDFVCYRYRPCIECTAVRLHSIPFVIRFESIGITPIAKNSQSNLSDYALIAYRLCVQVGLLCAKNDFHCASATVDTDNLTILQPLSGVGDIHDSGNFVLSRYDRPMRQTTTNFCN